MAEPLNLTDIALGTWPVDNADPVKATMRMALGELAKRNRSLPPDSTAHVGEIVAGMADGTGPSYASGTGATVIHSGGLPIVGGFAPVVVTSSIGLTTKLHFCRALFCRNAASVTLTINLDATGTNGVSDGFLCAIFREAAGQVIMAPGTGLTNMHPTGDTHVLQGLSARIIVLNGKLWFEGGTATTG